MSDEITPPAPAPAPAPPRRSAPAESQVLRGEREKIIARLASKASRLSHQSKQDALTITQLRNQLAEMGAELTTVRAAADTNAERQRADQLAAELRDIRHRGEFGRLAIAAGATPDLVDDLWTLSGYRPVDDAPDAAAIQGVIDGLKATRPRFFEPAPGPAPAPQPEPRPGPASGRGAPQPPLADDGINESEFIKIQRDPKLAFEQQKRIAHFLKNPHLIRRGQ